MPRKNHKGFTLIELLIVVAIIGVMATFFITTFVGPQKRARDGTRKSDIKQYQTALELFASKNNGLYPSRTNAANLGGVQASVTLCDDIGLTTCPENPLGNASGNSYWYRYQSNGSGLGNKDATQYVFWAKLEYDISTSSTDWWVVCSSGKSGVMTITGTTFTPIPTAGACPLP